MFSLFFVQVNTILNVFPLVFVQVKIIMVTSLEDNVFFCAIIEYFSLELTRLRDLTCKLSTHFNYHFNKIQAAFTTFKITFRSLV